MPFSFKITYFCVLKISDMEAIDNTKHEESNTDRGETTFSHLNKRISNYSSKHILPSSHDRRISQRNRQNQSMSTEYIDGLHNFGKVKQWLNTLPGNSTVHKPEVIFTYVYTFNPRL